MSKLKLTVGRDALVWWHVGMRIEVYPDADPHWYSTQLHKRRWYARVWRWLMRKNWRVATMDYARGEMTIRRAR